MNLARPSTPLDESTKPERSQFTLLSFSGRFRTLHLTWLAFFFAFVVWFDYAPFAATIANELGLTSNQTKAIGLCNVALTVPARIFIGMALDRWGPRRVFSTLLVLAVIPNSIFALSSSFETLAISRLALSIVGAGFVVGIRMVGEWFPESEVGMAEGIYGGWGNFGSAAAALLLPTIAGLFVEDGWRWSILASGFVAGIYGIIFLRSVTDTPEGVTYAKPAKVGAIEVTTTNDVRRLTALTIPPYIAVGVVAWQIYRNDIMSATTLTLVGGIILAMAAVQLVAVRRVNKPALEADYPADEQYPFRSVVALSMLYFATFGSELTIVTLLPAFFASTWDLGPALAGAAGASFACMNLVARPTGGLLSDRLSSRKQTLLVLLIGTAVGYSLLALAGSSWPLWMAIGACALCSMFVQASSGAVFAIVPLIKKPMTGQIAGMVGAYGNVGTIFFLTVSILTDTQTTFVVIAATTACAVVASRMLVEPTERHGAHDSAFADVTATAIPTSTIGSLR